MEVNFKDQLLDDYFKEIIAKNKELSMLKANIYGLLRNASVLIESKLRGRFMYKSIVTKKKHVEWRVTKIVVEPWEYHTNFSVKITLAGSPIHIVGKQKLTDKEKIILKKLQTLWDSQEAYYFPSDFYDLADQLTTLKHEYSCAKKLCFEFGLDDLMSKKDFNSIHFCLGDFDEDDFNFSTRDLKAI